MDAMTLQAEAERQAREGLRGPQQYKTHCIECERPFTFGVTTPDYQATVYSMAGARETQITGMCEACFDEICADIEGDDE